MLSPTLSPDKPATIRRLYRNRFRLNNRHLPRLFRSWSPTRMGCHAASVCSK